MVMMDVIPSVSEGAGGVGGAPRQPKRATRPPRSLATLGMTLAFAFSAQAEVIKVFGSAGLETQLTPAKPASPLLRGNTSAVTRQTNSGDAAAFIDVAPESHVSHHTRRTAAVVQRGPPDHHVGRKGIGEEEQEKDRTEAGHGAVHQRKGLKIT